MTDSSTTLSDFGGGVDQDTKGATQSQESTSNRSSPEADGHQDKSEVPLFCLSSDPFTNAGAAALVAYLKTQREITDKVEIKEDRLLCESGSVEAVTTDIAQEVKRKLENTHRRTVVAHQINHALKETGFTDTDERWVGRPTEPFPNDSTVYQNDEVSQETLAEKGIEKTEALEDLSQEGQNLYVLSEEYIGTNNPASFTSQPEAFDRHIAALENSLGTSRDMTGSTCLFCGRADLPSYEDPLSGEKVTYNQTFAPLASSSGSLIPLGARGSRTSKHQGRCVACLVAGFYFSLMPKPVCQTASGDNDARILTPLGTFDDLVPALTDIRAKHSDLDTPVGANNQNVRQRTIGNVQTATQAIQLLDLLEVFVRDVSTRERSVGTISATVNRPPTLATIVSEVGQTRSISRFDRIDLSDSAYHRVEEQEHEVGGETRRYWPVSDVLRWFGEYGDSGKYTDTKQRLGEGIIHGDLERVERGLLGFIRLQFNDKGSFPAYTQPHPADLTHYFTQVMTQTTTEEINEEDVEAIQNVASGIGSIFNEGENINILIGLQNASTQSEFLRAFERASMQAQKKSTDSPPAQYNTARNDDVQTVLELVSDDETFEPTKRMFVIQAALAAQYENAVGSDESEDEEEDK